MQIQLRYGKDGLVVEVPDENLAHLLRLNHLPILEDASAATRQALAEPIGTQPLAELARNRRDACIVVSDLTRPVPNGLLLPPILEALESAGLPPERITVLIATGLHRGNTPEEFAAMGLEAALARGVRVENHEARNRDSHEYLGQTSLDLPVWVDRRYVEADLRILTGLVEPHLMAGYSGGRKAICPGLCAVETVLRWHSPQMLEAPEACAGNLRNNQVHAQALEIARLAGGADMIVNVTLDEKRNVTGVFAGELEAAHLAAMEVAERQTKVVLEEPVDIVLTTAAGYPLDLTFYQGVKGMIGAAPIVKQGGTILIAQENAEGIGGPEYTELMLGMDSPQEYLQRAFRGEVCCIDQWQVQMQERVLRKAELMQYCTGLDRATLEKLFVKPVSSVEEGLKEALARHGSQARIAVIPEGPYVLACLRDDPVGSRSVREMVAD